ncbi:MAG: fasciclin domain-containing protein [Patescibacteria group bacterium]
MNPNTRRILIIGGAVIVALLLWWLMGWQSSTKVSNTATTTPQGGVSSGPGGVTVQNSPGTVRDVIADIEYGSRFSQLLSSTGVGATLTGKGPYTVFVSTDGAFGRLVPGTVNSLSATELKRLVQYHVVVGKRLDVDALQSGQIQALSRDTLNFNVDAAKKEVYVNSGRVIAAYSTSNGIVYVINSVLVPPKATQ